MTLRAPKRFGAYIEALRRKTKILNRQIDKEQSRPLPDWQKLRMLKSIRLRAKDAIKAHSASLPTFTKRASQNHQAELETL